MTAERSTIPEVLTRRRHRGEHPLLICDERADQLRRGRSALGTAGPRAASPWVRARAPMWACCTPTGWTSWWPCSPPPGSARWWSRSRPSRRRRSCVGSWPTVTSVSCCRCSHYRAHDYPVAARRGARHRLVRIPGASPRAAPQLRHVVFDTGDWLRPGHRGSHSGAGRCESDVDCRDPLAIVYTSGSTGTPKGAVHTHRGLLDHQRNLNDIRGLTAEDKLFSNSPFFWIGGFAFGLLATLIAGCHPGVLQRGRRRPPPWTCWRPRSRT